MVFAGVTVVVVVHARVLLSKAGLIGVRPAWMVTGGGWITGGSRGLGARVLLPPRPPFLGGTGAVVVIG